MKTIRDIEYVDGVKVLVRADFNVPIKHGAVGDDFRIRAALPTIDFLTNKGAVVILISHLESNDGENPSLAPIAKHLEKLGRTVTFIKDVKHAHEIIEAKMSEKKVGSGMIVLLENLRFSDGEKDNDPTFAKELSSLADVYVNEAFPVSHRAHASIVGVPKFLPSYAGLQFEKEVSHLSNAFTPGHPFVFVLGGAKFDTKLPLIARFSTIADIIFLGGALGNDALLAKGISVGASKISSGNVDISAMVSQPNIIVPIDATIQDHSAKDIDAIGAKDAILDAGPKTLALVGEKIRTAKFILWNGPLGPYEDGYVEGTKSVANMIADRTQADSSVVSMVGGGDTLAAIANLGIEDKFTFVSSGGGAMLDFLAKGTLPGIEALGASS
jgi:phosphoglycerate kinase